VCKRNTVDPLVRVFLDTYGLNLLAVPREGSAVGDLYVKDDKGLSAPGKLTGFLEPAPKLPAIKKAESMADIQGVVSRGVTTSVGLKFLSGFFGALGALPLIDKLGATYKARKAGVLKFRFADALRDSMDPVAFGTRLIGCQPIKGHPMVADGNQYFVVTAVARTPSISVTAERDDQAGASIDLDVKELAAVSPSVEVKQTSQGELTFRGTKALAFGVQLHEVTFDIAQNRVRLKTTGAVTVRRGGPAARPLATPVLLGGSDADAFVAL
jgi:hypothetical protein